MKTHQDALFIVMITLLFSFSKGTEVQKICRDDTAPFRLSCISNTGVSIQSVSVQFTSNNTINKECETLIFYNITENTRPFQDMCNRASDRSMCILDQGYVISLFQPSSVPPNIYMIPIRLLFIYDCLEIIALDNTCNLKKSLIAEIL
ncbi:hypothetical protein BpHYR1_047094 [Brachionus plicatilis]|uniref:Uncharacterized protein n=1 Tax=Brachionus plicatilis TaxID=10195 RepID=A0A3M7Q865_BRAPC|nr:hypothetical protein BpHYR1_047094 [Brachionus plicatilis]